MNNEVQFNLYEQKKNRKKYLIFTVVLLVLLGIGYAYLQTLLTISGTANVSGAQWDIYWRNISIDPNSVSTTPSPSSSASLSPATIAPSPSDNTSVTFTVMLDKPGDYYEFTVEAYNDGTMDAFIGSINQSIVNNNITYNMNDVSSLASFTSLAPYLEYEVTYADYFPIKQHQILKAGQSETYRVRVGYKKDINAAQLPQTAQIFTVTFGVTYAQIEGEAIELPSSTYSSSPVMFTIGQAVPNTAVTQNTFQAASTAAMTALGGHQLFMRYGLKNNVVDKAYIVLKKDGKVYYVDTSRSNYSEVVTQLTGLFDSGDCDMDTETDDQTGEVITSYNCQGDDVLVQMWYDSQGFAVNVMYDLAVSGGIPTAGYSCSSCDLGSNSTHFTGCGDISQNSQIITDFMSSCYLMQ